MIWKCSIWYSLQCTKTEGEPSLLVIESSLSLNLIIERLLENHLLKNWDYFEVSRTRLDFITTTVLLRAVRNYRSQWWWAGVSAWLSWNRPNRPSFSALLSTGSPVRTEKRLSEEAAAKQLRTEIHCFWKTDLKIRVKDLFKLQMMLLRSTSNMRTIPWEPSSQLLHWVRNTKRF